MDQGEIAIDEWPFLEPHLEIEAKTKEEVIQISTKLGFSFKTALFCGVTHLYELKYGLTADTINNHTPNITFDMLNPFIK